MIKRNSAGYLAVFTLSAALLTSCTPDTPKVTNANTNNTEVNSSAYSSNSNTTPVTKAETNTLDAVATQAQPPAKGEEIAVITTSMGTMKMRFFPEEAPDSVANFKALAKEGYYNGHIFHRVIEDFVIQGGDPTGTGTSGKSSTGAPIKDEKNTVIKHIFGAVGMAKSGPNTATSQFYIVVNPNGTAALDGGYTVYAQIFDGLEVADTISKVETATCGYMEANCQDDKPLTDVVMEKIEIVPYEG